MIRPLWIAILAFLFSLNAEAQTSCSTAGIQAYTSSVMQYCDGTYWISMKGASNGTCAAGSAGVQSYTSGAMQFCDGTNWYLMKGGNSGSCAGTTAGTQRFSSPKYQFCDGTNWYDMGFVAYVT